MPAKLYNEVVMFFGTCEVRKRYKRCEKHNRSIDNVNSWWFALEPYHLGLQTVPNHKLIIEWNRWRATECDVTIELVNKRYWGRQFQYNIEISNLTPRSMYLTMILNFSLELRHNLQQYRTIRARMIRKRNKTNATPIFSSPLFFRMPLEII